MSKSIQPRSTTFHGVGLQELLLQKQEQLRLEEDRRKQELCELEFLNSGMSIGDYINSRSAIQQPLLDAKSSSHVPTPHPPFVQRRKSVKDEEIAAGDGGPAFQGVTVPLLGGGVPIPISEGPAPVDVPRPVVIKVEEEQEDPEIIHERLAREREREEDVLQKAQDIEKERSALSLRRFNRWVDPPRNKTHWDYVIEEMTWMANDFKEERKWKMALARKTSKNVQKYHKDREVKDKDKVKDEEARVRKVASQVAKEVKKFWSQIEALVLHKHQKELDEKKKAALDKHLDFLVGQTERYSSMLANDLVGEARSSNGPERAESVASGRKSAEEKSEERPAKRPRTGEEDQEDSADKEFKPPEEEEEEEDEVAEEEEGPAEDEVDLLAKEAEMPLEELLKRLPPMQDEEEEEREEDEDEVDDDDDDSVRGVKDPEPPPPQEPSAQPTPPPPLPSSSSQQQVPASSSAAKAPDQLPLTAASIAAINGLEAPHTGPSTATGDNNMNDYQDGTVTDDGDVEISVIEMADGEMEGLEGIDHAANHFPLHHQHQHIVPPDANHQHAPTSNQHHLAPSDRYQHSLSTNNLGLVETLKHSSTETLKHSSTLSDHQQTAHNADTQRHPAAYPHPTPSMIPASASKEVTARYSEEGSIEALALHDSEGKDDEEKEFVPSNEDTTDDEATLDEEEKKAKGDEHREELAALERDKEMTLEELVALYGREGRTSAMGDLSDDTETDEEDEEGVKKTEVVAPPSMSISIPQASANAGRDTSAMTSPEKPSMDGSDGEHDNAKQEAENMMKLKQKEKPKEVEGSRTNKRAEDSDDEEPGLHSLLAGDGHEQTESERITAAAASAAEAQPTGYTLATTKVKTKVPFLLKGTLREYQHIGLDWLVNMFEKKLNGILADEMGLGKTIMTISLLAYLAVERGIWGPHLVVVPTSVMLNWEIEFKKFCPAFKVLCYFGSQKERKEKRKGWQNPNSFHVCITSYKLVIQDQVIFRRKKWKYFILDEAHNIKNFRSQRWQLLLNFNSKRRLLLTGTPLQNNLMELWSLMHFLMPHIFQSHKEFKDWFSNPVNNMVEGGENINKDIITRLHGILRPFILRRLKEDVEKSLPPKTEHVLLCPLSKRQRFLYEDFMSRSDTRSTLASGNFMGIANVLMQLRKVCNHPDMFEVRPIASPFDMEGIVYNTASLVLSALDKGPWSVDLRSLNFVFSAYEEEFSLSISDRSSELITPRDQLIVELPPLLPQLPAAPPTAMAFPTPGLPAASPPPSTRPSLLHQRAVIRRQKRERELRDRMDHWNFLNRLRCARRPLFGWQLRRCVGQLGPADVQYFATRPACYMDYPNSLLQFSPTPEQLAESYEDIVKSFMCIIPRARTCTIKIHCSHPNPSDVLAKRRLEFDLCRVLLPKLDIYRQGYIRTQLFFPDKRLIQYDCGKLQVLAKLLRQLKQENSRALIFTQMTKVLDVLEIFLSIYGYTYLRLDGSTKVEDRQKLTERFNGSSKYFLFILSTRSGGVGLNLTGANSVIFYDSDWNPSMDRQAQDRCHRIGQTKQVHVYRLISERTVEENILKKANQKRFLNDLVMKAGQFNPDAFKQQEFNLMDLFDADYLNDQGTRLIKEPPPPQTVIQPRARAPTPSQGASSSASQEASIPKAPEVATAVPSPPPPLEGFEDALENVQDETDIDAMKHMQDEEAEEQAEFTEEIVPLDEEGNVIKFGPDDEMMADFDTLAAQAGLEPTSIESQLTPIQRYAFRFVEEVNPPAAAQELSALTAEVHYEEKEWELDQLQRLKEEEEMRADDEDEPLFYEVPDNDAAAQAYLLAQQQLKLYAPLNPDMEEEYKPGGEYALAEENGGAFLVNTNNEAVVPSMESNKRSNKKGDRRPSKKGRQEPSGQPRKDGKRNRDRTPQPKAKAIKTEGEEVQDGKIPPAVYTFEDRTGLQGGTDPQKRDRRNRNINGETPPSSDEAPTIVRKTKRARIIPPETMAGTEVNQYEQRSRQSTTLPSDFLDPDFLSDEENGSLRSNSLPQPLFPSDPNNPSAPSNPSTPSLPAPQTEKKRKEKRKPKTVVPGSVVEGEDVDGLLGTDMTRTPKKTPKKSMKARGKLDSRPGTGHMSVGPDGQLFPLEEVGDVKKRGRGAGRGEAPNGIAQAGEEPTFSSFSSRGGRGGRQRRLLETSEPSGGRGRGRGRRMSPVIEVALWTPDEDRDLRDAVDSYGECWSLVCDLLNSAPGRSGRAPRTPQQCVERYQALQPGACVPPITPVPPLATSSPRPSPSPPPSGDPSPSRSLTDFLARSVFSPALPLTIPRPIISRQHQPPLHHQLSQQPPSAHTTFSNQPQSDLQHSSRSSSHSQPQSSIPRTSSNPPNPQSGRVAFPPPRHFHLLQRPSRHMPSQLAIPSANAPSISSSVRTSSLGPGPSSDQPPGHYPYRTSLVATPITAGTGTAANSYPAFVSPFALADNATSPLPSGLNPLRKPEEGVSAPSSNAGVPLPSSQPPTTPSVSQRPSPPDNVHRTAPQPPLVSLPSSTPNMAPQPQRPPPIPSSLPLPPPSSQPPPSMPSKPSQQQNQQSPAPNLVQLHPPAPSSSLLGQMVQVPPNPSPQQSQPVRAVGRGVARSNPSPSPYPPPHQHIHQSLPLQPQLQNHPTSMMMPPAPMTTMAPPPTPTLPLHSSVPGQTTMHGAGAPLQQGPSVRLNSMTPMMSSAQLAQWQRMQMSRQQQQASQAAPSQPTYPPTARPPHQMGR